VAAESNLAVEFDDRHARIEAFPERGIVINVDDRRPQAVLNEHELRFLT
jgi:hypothetical protein